MTTFPGPSPTKISCAIGINLGYDQWPAIRGEGGTGATGDWKSKIGKGTSEKDDICHSQGYVGWGSKTVISEEGCFGNRGDYTTVGFNMKASLLFLDPEMFIYFFIAIFHPPRLYIIFGCIRFCFYCFF